MAKKVLIAIGGNALIQAGEKGSINEQLNHVSYTAKCFLEIIKEGYLIAITHGNGPQVGSILLKNEYAKDKLPPMPLDVCGAESQGFIGYMLQRLIYSEVKKNKKDIPVLTILTQVLVDKNDPAFKHPTKPLGLFYTEEESKVLEKEEGWIMTEQIGKGYRRVVPSPEPLKIIEGESIKKLFKEEAIVIACGGGGIPVIQNEDGSLTGVESVIDKDKTASVLAKEIKADILMILTDVENASINFHKPNQQDIGEIKVKEIRKYLDENQFGKGSMGPKVEAACRFVEAGGKKSIISSLSKAKDALGGRTGTIITL